MITPYQVHVLNGHIQQIYLLEYAHGFLLMDGCCRVDVPLILAQIRKLGRPLQDLRVVCVTHQHPDHAGGAHRLRRLTGCKLVTLNKPGQWYSGISGLTMYAVDNALAMYVAQRLGRPRRWLFYPPFLRADVHMNEGDRLPVFADWQAIDTHGHTDRDLSLWHADTRSIYVADLIIKLKQRYVAPFPVYFVDSYRQSVAKVRALQPLQVWLAHGGICTLDEADWAQIERAAPRRRRTVADKLRYYMRAYAHQHWRRLRNSKRAK